MGAGYYEHDIEVRFTEELLQASDSWQWLIDYTEGNFDPSLEAASLLGFGRAFSSIQPVYVHLSRVVDLIGDFQPDIKSSWLKSVYDCVLVRSGLMEPEAILGKDVFFNMLCVASFGTRLMNCVSETRRLYNPQLLYHSNLYQLFDLAPLGSDRQRFVELARAVDVPEFMLVVNTLRANFEEAFVPADAQYVEGLMDEHFDVNFLSYKGADAKLGQTWQEALLCDALRVSYSNGAIEPMIKLRDGTGAPDTSQWTETVLALAKDAFVDKRAVCVIEVLEHSLLGKTPSRDSQDLLVDVFLDYANQCVTTGQPLRKLSCTVLNVLRTLIEAKQLDKEPRGRYYRTLSDLLSGVSDYDDICFMKSHALPCTEAQNEIFIAKTASITKDSLAATTSAYDLINVFKDARCARSCDLEDAKRSFELLLKYSSEGGLMAAELFYWAMMFFIDVLDNPRVDNQWAKETLIALRHIWQEEYYAAVRSGMHAFTHEGTIASAEVDELNRVFLEAPHNIAHGFFLQSEEDIISEIESMSEHALVYLFNKTVISEYYPEHVHVTYKEVNRSIDYMIVSEITRIYEENEYRFINALKRQDLIDGYFDVLSQRVQLGVTFLNVKPAYEWIVDNAPSCYEMLPYPEARPLLGHLTQFFPIIENVIRDIGERFAIVPFQASKDSFSCLKDVSSVLADMIGELRDITGTIQGSNEFLFVYYVMYSPNGPNIRNDCIHGRQYQDPSGVARAFRPTVVCAYMMLKRLRYLEAIGARNEGEGEES